MPKLAYGRLIITFNAQKCNLFKIFGSYMQLLRPEKYLIVRLVVIFNQ
jgi:hypothetical protein